MILVAGIGNIFLGDDGFGSEVARQLSRRVLDPSVRVIDFGIRGMDLLYTLLDEYDATIIVDALPQQGRTGHPLRLRAGFAVSRNNRSQPSKPMRWIRWPCSRWRVRWARS